MIEILSYTLILVLFLVITFFLIRTSIVAFSMTTEVPFLPSNQLFKKAFEYLEIQRGDKVLDIGSGDGRVLFWASKQYPQAQFVGIERNPILVLYSKFKKFVLNRRNLQFKCINAHDFNMKEFNKIYIYLLPDFIDTLLLNSESKLKEGCSIVSFHYPMGKKFSSINKIAQYPVKYRNRRDNIYKWTNK